MATLTEAAVRPEPRRRATAWRQLLLHRGAIAGGCVLAVVVLACALAGIAAPYGPAAPDYAAPLHGPSAGHLLGTDQFGRDILSRILYGGRVSLAIAAAGTLVSAAVGSLLGLVTGYYGGLLDLLLMRVMDVMLAFPGILIAIGIVALIGPGLINVLIAVSVFGVPVFARLVRGETMRLRSELFIEAARAGGARSRDVIYRHLLPNILPLIVIYATLRTANAILVASGLGFLGLGVQPPNPEWGTMLADGRQFLSVAGWVALFPGLAILVTTLSLNLLGEGLRDALDPRMSAH
jgi:glutathione transport system permease protein